MNNSEFPTFSGYAVGYIKPAGQPWQPVLGSIVNENGVDYVVAQGCIILGTLEEMNHIATSIQQQPALLTDPDVQLMGTVIVGGGARWPDNTVPYEIDGALPNKERVINAIKVWSDNTYVRFVQHNGEKDYVVFVPVNSGCASTVGRRGRKQEIWLSDSCSTGNVIHEIGHTLGLWHEQSRIDRDDHIRIMWNNIHPGMRSNFDQHVSDGKDVGPYDYDSIMHYSDMAFSINGSRTIIPIPHDRPIGQRSKLSDGDIATINAIYPKSALVNSLFDATDQDNT